MTNLDKRKLPVRAALAAGYQINENYSDKYYPDDCKPDTKSSKPALLLYDLGKWNPLENDGDALRLAVKLNMLSLSYSREDWEQCNQDGYAATRLAIVKAAADLCTGYEGL